jgi:iron(III) transport system substrate-binding protein
LQAAEQGLLEEYKSPLLPQLQPWAQRQAEQSKYRTVGIYLGALGIAYNTELMAKKKLTPPTCWKDLIKPEFVGEVQMANPNASGTAYTAIATIVQVFGEEEAFKYLKALHKNINNYPRSGVAPVKAVARGETLTSVSFIHDVVTEAQAGFPVRSAAPCEGTGYEIGSLSIVKGARNLDNAKKFVDWALTAKAQALGAQSKQFQIPSNVNAPISPLSPKIADIKLINYDFAKYGTSAERKRLLERWDREVGSQPR